jgi:hypothetical protein
MVTVDSSRKESQWRKSSYLGSRGSCGSDSCDVSKAVVVLVAVAK